MARKLTGAKSKNRKKVSLTKLSKELRQAEQKKQLNSKKKHKLQLSLAKAKRRKQLNRAHFPYSPTQHILLVGEANCSFARALIRKFRQSVTDRLRTAGYPVPTEDEAKHGPPVDFKLLDMLLQKKAQQMRRKMGMFEPGDEQFDEYDEYDEDNEDEDDEDNEYDEDNEIDQQQNTTMNDLDDEDDEFDEDDDDDEDDDEDDEDMDQYDIDLANGIEHNNGLLRYTYQTCGENLLVTCYDSLEDAIAKYDDLPKIIKEIQSAGGKVVFGVDCTSMGELLNEHNLVPPNKFDTICFNFPHVGSGEKDQSANIKENQNLILGYLSQSLSLIRKPHLKARHNIRSNMHEFEDDANEQLTGVNKPKHNVNDKGSQSFNENFTMTRGGLITLTVKSGEPYDSWRIPAVARIVNHNQLQAQNYKEEVSGVKKGDWSKKFPKLQLLRRDTFFPEIYPGYAHRRTIGFKTGMSKEGNEEISKSDPKTFVFCRAPENFIDKSIGLSFSGLGDEQKSHARKAKQLKGRKNKPTTIKQVLKARTTTKSGRKRR